MRFILLLTLLGYAHSQSCDDPYTLVMRDGNHDGWNNNGLLLSATVLLATGSDGTAFYSLDSGSNHTVELCNLQELKVARKTSTADQIESSFSLSKGDETFEWSNYLEADTVLFSACEEGSWTGSQCAPCGAGFVSSVGICKPRCLKGFTYQDDQCTCDDPYTLIMKDSEGNGWYQLQLEVVTADGVEENVKIPYDSQGGREEQTVDLCRVTGLFVRGNPSTYDQQQSSFTLKKGEDPIHEWGENGDLSVSEGYIWKACEEGKQWSQEDGECICPNPNPYTLVMRDGWGDGWNGLLLSATYSNGATNYSLDSGSNHTVELCNLQELKVSRSGGNYDNLESSFSLSKGNETFEWSEHLQVNTVLFSDCEEGSWTGTECAPCGAGFVSSVGICKPRCPQGYAYQNNECTCDDKYTLIMEDTAGNGWWKLRLKVHTGDGDERLVWIPFTKGLTTRKKQTVELCDVTGLSVFRTPTTSSGESGDALYSKFTLKKGEDPIQVWGNDGDLSLSEGYIWKACGEGSQWSHEDGQCICPDPYTLVMRDGWGDGWDSNGLRLSATYSNGATNYSLDSGSNHTVELCNLQELKVSRSGGSWDYREASFSLSKGNETFDWSEHLQVNTVLFSDCEEGSWTGTECAPCGAGYESSVGICKPRCPQGYAYQNNECTCDDKYTLIMEDTAGNGWYSLRLRVYTDDGRNRLHWIPFKKGTSRTEQTVDLCGVTGLAIARLPTPGTSDSGDALYSKFTLKKGEDTIHAWGKDGDLSLLAGYIWRACEEGSQWSHEDGQCICTEYLITVTNSNGLHHLEFTATGDNVLVIDTPQEVCLSSLSTLAVTASPGSYTDSRSTRVTIAKSGTQLATWRGYSSSPLWEDFTGHIWANCPDGKGFADGECKLCDSGYRAGENGLCVPCHANQIVENNLCITCPSGELRNSENICEGCPPGQGLVSADDLRCDICSDTQILVDGVCTDCAFGEEVVHNECVCNGDTYVLELKDRYLDAWQGLTLKATSFTEEERVFVLQNAREESYNICNLYRLEIGTAAGHWDRLESSFRLLQGDTELYSWLQAGEWRDLPSGSTLWADCPEGTDLVGTECSECVDINIAVPTLCHGILTEFAVGSSMTDTGTDGVSDAFPSYIIDGVSTGDPLNVDSSLQDQERFCYDRCINMDATMAGFFIRINDNAPNICYCSLDNEYEGRVVGNIYKKYVITSVCVYRLASYDTGDMQAIQTTGAAQDLPAGHTRVCGLERLQLVSLNEANVTVTGKDNTFRWSPLDIFIGGNDAVAALKNDPTALQDAYKQLACAD